MHSQGLSFFYILHQRRYIEYIYRHIPSWRFLDGRLAPPALAMVYRVRAFWQLLKFWRRGPEFYDSDDNDVMTCEYVYTRALEFLEGNLARPLRIWSNRLDAWRPCVHVFVGSIHGRFQSSPRPNTNRHWKFHNYELPLYRVGHDMIWKIWYRDMISLFPRSGYDMNHFFSSDMRYDMISLFSWYDPSIGRHTSLCRKKSVFVALHLDSA